MRKTLLLVSLILSINSCSKDSSGTSAITTQEIIGRWKMIKAYDKNSSNTTANLFKSSSYADITANTIAFHYTDSLPQNSSLQNLQVPYTKDGTKLYSLYGYFNIDQISTSQLILSEYDQGGYAETILFTK